MVDKPWREDNPRRKGKRKGRGREVREEEE
jgi:hypothetical protein